MDGKGLFTNAGGSLIPVDGRAREIVHQLKFGDKVLVQVRRPRNPEHNAIAHMVFRYIGQARGVPEDIVKLWLKRECGLIDVVKLPNGKRVPDVKSVAFESMTQDEFQAFWNDALEVIKAEILPDLPEREYEKIREMIAGRAEAA